MRKWISAATTTFMVLGFAAVASAQTYSAQPWTFVGKADVCGNPYPAGAKIVTSTWQTGMGLPDNGTANPDGKDPHNGLLLSKNGPTANCSSAGATIQGWTPGTIQTLGFDYRNGGHCGAGAPRFNVTDNLGNTYFFGCTEGAHSPAPQDPTQWERVAYTVPTAGSAGFIFGVTTVTSIEIVLDEGTDSASADDPNGVGLAVLDNIRINNTVIRNKKGTLIAP